MSNPNKTTRIVLRWTHLVVGFLIGVFVYIPAHDNEALVLLVQAVVVPAVALTRCGCGNRLASGVVAARIGVTRVRAVGYETG